LQNACFKRLKDENYFKGQEFHEYISNIVDFYCVTNMIHPFREGNGRTQRIFISQLIRLAGYDIDFSKIDTNNLMSATIHAAGGVDVFLKEIFNNTIVKQEKKQTTIGLLFSTCGKFVANRHNKTPKT